MAEHAHRDTHHATPNGTAPPDQPQWHSAFSETRGSPSPTTQRPMRSPETSLFAAPNCVERLPLRSAKRPLQPNIHQATHPLTHVRDSLRLPRKTMPGHAAGHTIPHACHVKRTPCARSPTPTTRNVHTHARSRHGELHRPIATELATPPRRHENM